MDLKRVAELRAWRLGSETAPVAPGSHVVQGARGSGAARPGPSSQRAKEPSRRHCPSGRGAHACAESDSTKPAQPAGPRSPSARHGCVSPATRAAGGRSRWVGRGGVSRHRKLSMSPVSSQPHPTPQGPQFRGKIPPLCECPSWGPSATFWPATHQHYQVSPILLATGAQMRLLSTLNSLSWWSLPACGCHPPGSSTSLPTGCSHPKAPCSLGPKEPLGNCVINRTVKPFKGSHTP